MGKIMAVHSYRGGTGKSSISANIAGTLATQGLRVGIVDTDFNSPGIHVLLGLDEDQISYTLNDYLVGECAIEQAIHNVSHITEHGELYFIPSSTSEKNIGKVLNEGYDAETLHDGLFDFVDHLELDVLVIDTHPGIHEQTMLMLAICDAVAIVMRPDHQDFQGTSILVEIVRRIGVPFFGLVINKNLPAYDWEDLKATVKGVYKAPVLGLLPLDMDLIYFQSLATQKITNLYAIEKPQTAWSDEIRQIGMQMLTFA